MIKHKRGSWSQCVDINHSSMMACQHMGGERSKQEDEASHEGSPTCVCVCVWEGLLSLCLHRQESYLLIDSEWGIFGREILGVHGSLHYQNHCLPGILGKHRLIKQTNLKPSQVFYIPGIKNNSLVSRCHSTLEQKTLFQTEPHADGCFDLLWLFLIHGYFCHCRNRLSEGGL